MNYTQFLAEIEKECRPLLTQGRVATYIAPLAAIPREQFGMSLRTVEGDVHATGDADRPFTIQSIAKVLSLALAMRLVGDAIWQRVGREPSGTAFNSLVQLEAERGRPRNPMINAGALVVVDTVLEAAASGGDPFIEFARETACEPELDYDHAVAEAEYESADGNRALAYFLKSFGVLRGDPQRVLEAYCRLCSLTMSTNTLCRAFAFLATGGRSPEGRQVVSPRQVKRLNAVMLTCGVYDEAGDFAYRVGLPAKSGVGGGIVAALPGSFVTAVWSPGLGPKGNSLAGTMALELLTTKTGTSIF